MGWKRRALDAAHRAGTFSVASRLYGRRRLTVLAYHRIVDPEAADFRGFIGNVSATPAEFAQQMEWVARSYTPVTLDDVAAAAAGAALPEQAVLVSFDDGYRDNLTTAAPVLDELGLSAALFVATGVIETGSAPWWDLVAEWFRSSPVREADLPIIGPRAWDDVHLIAAEWVRAAKGPADDALRGALDRLAGTLEVDGDRRIPGLMLSWDELAEISRRGWELGGHTSMHPILTRLPFDRAVQEITTGRDRVAEVLGSRPIGFAYPNGQRADYNAAVCSAVADAGFRVAFTLQPGPARFREVAADPMAIRRVYVHRGDGVSRLDSKIALSRMVKGLR